MSENFDKYRQFRESMSDEFEEWETESMDIEELQEVDVDITDLMIHLLKAYKEDEVHILNDVKSQSILIIIPAMEESSGA